MLLFQYGIRNEQIYLKRKCNHYLFLQFFEKGSEETNCFHLGNLVSHSIPQNGKTFSRALHVVIAQKIQLKQN
jgi:hypothetical protein